MEERKYYGFIYLWENTHPLSTIHKKYIGQHIGTLEDGYIGSGTIFLKRFYSKKYRGFWNRCILQICHTKEELNEAEKYWIKLHNAQFDPIYCNIREGGGNRGKHHPDTILLLKQNCKGRKAWNAGIKGIFKATPETKQKRASSFKEWWEPMFKIECNNILTHIEQNNFIKAKDIAKFITRRTPEEISAGYRANMGPIQKRLNYLLKENKIKRCNVCGMGVYVLFALSIEDEILKHIESNNKLLTKNDIANHMHKTFFVTNTGTKKILEKLSRAGKLHNYRKNIGARRINYYYVEKN